MRRERSFLILVVLGIALGAYIYFVERKRPASDEPEQKAKVFENVQEAEVEEIVVTAQDATTRLKKAGDSWQIVEPIKADADREQVNNLTGNFATLERNAVVDENPASVKQFGLDPPRADVSFRTRGSSTMRRLLVGNKAPAGGDLYAQVGGEKRVILISGFMDNVFAKTTFDLRDKSVLRFDRDKTDALEIVSSGRKMRLVHSPTEWRMAEPLQVRADFGTAEGIVGRLATTQMRSLVSSEAEPALLKQHGLADPAHTVTIVSGSSRASLLIGSPGPDGTLYAKDAARPLVFTVESSLADDLKKPPSEFRRKDVFDFRPFNATRVDIARDGKTFTFEKVKADEKSAPGTVKWRQTAPAPRDVDLQKMDSLLSAFSNLRADSWVDKAAGLGLERPQIAFAVSFDDGKKQERLSFAKQGDAAHVVRADEPGAAKIPTTDYDAAVRALDDVLK
ncbi:MAG TPA: DUF4340 domain-containing protein [Vicinamibacterales bacterium]|nr:DUF4340 domain-containing protein [Vicinamibacterales bacterium]